jgi:hypothetical protein
MKRTRAVGIAFVVFVLGITLGQAQTSTSKNKTVWVPPPVGSHIGGHYEDAGDVESKGTSELGKAGEKSDLASAVARLDARANTVVEGHALLPTAVSIQTGVTTAVLTKQRASSGLSYGQLLVANSLASGSGKSFDQILALRAKSQSWSQLATSLHINPKSIIGRINAADDQVRFAESRRRLRREENLKDSGFHPGARIGKIPGT